MIKKFTVTQGDTRRAIEEIVIKLNELINEINSGVEGDTSVIGKIKVIKKDDGSYEINVKHAEGWVTTTASFKEN